MRSRLLAIGLASAALGLGVALAQAPGVAAAAAGSAQAPTAVAAAEPDASAARLSAKAIGLTDDGRLVRFSLTKPAAVTPFGPIRGLTPGSRLIGIDYRVQDRYLYGVGNDGAVYQLFPSSGATAATPVGSLTVPLAGTTFDIDFNPAADRLRIVSDTGQNLRHDLNTGVTTMDGLLSYVPPTAAMGINAAAYTNNDLSAATATTLFDIDTMLDQVVLQAPPNAGTLLPTGSLGVDSRGDAGFDIQTALAAGQADSNRAFATLRVSDTGSQLYRISLLTGRAQLVGSFPKNAVVVDLALPLDGS
jgi:hypothetical protein